MSKMVQNQVIDGIGLQAWSVVCRMPLYSELAAAL